MLWLTVTILAYFFLAVVSLFDRYFLVGSIPNPKVYTFYVGIIWFFVCMVLLPLGITFPVWDLLILGMLAGAVRIFAILFLTKSIVESEVSRAVPAIGGFLPIFSFLLFLIFLPSGKSLNLLYLATFILLVLGSVLISLKELNRKFLSFKILKNPIVSAFLFALTYFLTKILFLKVDFWSGLFLILLGGGLGAAGFLIFKKTRELIFSHRPTQKMSGIFFLGQFFGGLGVGLLYFAVFLARPGQVPLINALEGIRYVFLLFFVFLFSAWKPGLLKEGMKGASFYQKIIAILLIGGGLVLLAL